jgi:hypothetical protein
MPIAVAGASILGGVLAGNAASDAAKTQAQGANSAAALEANSAKQALDFQKQVYGQTQAEENPYLQAGYGGLANLESLLGITPQGNAVQAGAIAPGGNPTAGPRYTMGDTYKGGLFNSWGGSEWKYAGQKGDQDIYTRTNGSPAWDSYGPAGWSRGGAGTFSGFDAGTTPGSRSSTAARSNVALPGGGATNGGAPLSSLVNPQLGGFGSLMQPYSEKFTAPTAATEQNDPGYQFRLNEGEKALQNSAAAKGTLLNGATAAGINAYGQDYASNEYGNVYNRALGEYQQRYNIFQNDQTSKYNRLAALAGVGQTTASQLGSAGQNFANSGGSILMSNAYGQGQQINNAAAARASGYGAGGWTGALGSQGFGSLAALGGKLYNDKYGDNG